MANEILFQEVESRVLLSQRKQFVWKDAGKEMGGSFGALMKYVGMNRLKMAGSPICIAHGFDRDGGDMECGVMLADANPGTDEITSSMSYGGKVAVIDDTTPYESTGQAWSSMFDVLKEKGIEKNGAPWEEYITDLASEPDMSKWVSKLYQPIK